jgi:iron complex transport system permease protein
MKHTARPYVLCFLLLAGALLLSVAVGSVFIPPLTLLRIFIDGVSGNGSAANGTATLSTILFDLRLPRTALVAMTGAALAGSGTSYQACSIIHWPTHT